jgi:hypothetical protein
MIVEHRLYTLHPGKVPEYMKHYKELGYDIQCEVLGPPVGWYFTEIGTLNQIIHMWKYEDLADRTKRRAALAAHPGWPIYLAAITPLLIRQESIILNPAPWFTPKP